MELFLIDAIGPFFRGYDRERVNWSKIPFMHLDGLDASGWAEVEEEMRCFAGSVMEQGYNAVTLDDLAHLAPHPLHEPSVMSRIAFLRERFSRIFDFLTKDFGLRVFLTSDVLPMTPGLVDAMVEDPDELEGYYRNLVRGVLEDFPQLAGLVMRVGESDGHDVKDPIRTLLHLRNPAAANRLLRQMLPDFEHLDRELIFRTWTVGAHRIGDLIWSRETLDRTLEGLDSPKLIVSMKHGESDFFRYLPLNPAFSHVKQRKLLELQARREYEGAGEYPAFIGWDCERFASELSGVQNMAGISVWCQTGGWHRFRRRAFLEKDGRDVWIRLNTQAAISVFKDHKSANEAVETLLGPERTTATMALLGHADRAIRDILYVPEFASTAWYFRRVRIPPMLHVYWDSLFVNHALRKLMRHLVTDAGRTLAEGEQAAMVLPEMVPLAMEAGLPAEDVEHLCDFLSIVLLARRCYFGGADETIWDEIRAAKRAYKRRWPRHQRYRIRISEDTFPVRRRVLSMSIRLLLRNRSDYRVLDRLLLLYLASPIFDALLRTRNKVLPKLLRKSAMGVQTLLK